MIKRLELRNFRCFKHLELPLKQFNVLVGESASGKTALLESMFLLAGGSPEIYFRTRSWRGFSRQLNLSGTREGYQAIFRDIFYGFNQSVGVVLSCEDDNEGSRRLEIAYSDTKHYALDLNEPEPHAFVLSPVSFKWILQGKVYNTSVSFKEGKFVIEGAAPVSPLVYYNAVNTSSFENGSAFSDLSRKFRSSSLLTALSKIYPSVRELTLELIAGEPTLCVATGLDERLPLGGLSGGVSKFVTIALGILANPNGTVIIDEIESGFYYRDMPEIWNTLVTLCKQEKVQLIVSTHSYEFLKAAAPILANSDTAKYSQLLRSELDGSAERIIRKISAEALNAATSQEFEVR
jgi:energy-coupling factor transporter ATP-binding protein EcfA2